MMMDMTTETTETAETAETTMTAYRCDDGNAEIEIVAASPGAAAREYVSGGDWGELESSTWIDVYVWGDGEDREDAEKITVTLHPEAPECTGGREHDWCSPLSLVGGIAENPGVWGHGGGVRVHEVCSHCGTHRHTDTWAQRPDTGEQGLESVRYEDADDDTLAWVRRRACAPIRNVWDGAATLDDATDLIAALRLDANCLHAEDDAEVQTSLVQQALDDLGLDDLLALRDRMGR